MSDNTARAICVLIVFVILRQWFGEGAVSVSQEITVQLILLMLPKDLILPLEEASSSFTPTGSCL